MPVRPARPSDERALEKIYAPEPSPPTRSRLMLIEGMRTECATLVALGLAGAVACRAGAIPVSDNPAVKPAPAARPTPTAFPVRVPNADGSVVAWFSGEKPLEDPKAPLVYGVTALAFEFAGDAKRYPFRPLGELYFRLVLRGVLSRREMGAPAAGPLRSVSRRLDAEPQGLPRRHRAARQGRAGVRPVGPGCARPLERALGLGHRVRVPGGRRNAESDQRPRPGHRQVRRVRPDGSSRHDARFRAGRPLETESPLRLRLSRAAPLDSCPAEADHSRSW